jgi:hypothetical protein
MERWQAALFASPSGWRLKHRAYRAWAWETRRYLTTSRRDQKKRYRAYSAARRRWWRAATNWRRRQAQSAAGSHINEKPGGMYQHQALRNSIFSINGGGMKAG